ncbi:MAG TPA: FtsX-like permease family protein [Ktedonobacterales bacterium]|jgi:ABC-type antimicrobial peptide transport system permease subunit
MSRFFSARLRKSLADVTRRKGRTLLVTLGIFIGVFGLTVINSVEDTLVSAFAYTRGYQATQPDFQMTVDRLDPAVLPTLRGVANVKTVQYVSLLSVCWQPGDADCSVGIDLASYPDLQQASTFQLTAGRYPRPGEIVMEQGDRSLHTFSIGDAITLSNAGQSTEAAVVGLARTPGVNPAATGDARAYMSDAGLQQVFEALGAPQETRPDGQQVPALQHHIQVTFVTSGGQAATAATALQETLRAHGVTILDSGFAPKVSVAELDGINGVFVLLRILALLAVVLSALLILNTITTLVTEQTAIIGAMKAIGAIRGAIMRGYLLTVAIYSVLATIPAIALGLYAGNLLASMLAPQIPLELGPFTIAPWVVALSLAVGLGVPILAALFPLWNGTRVTVREALLAYGIDAGHGRGASSRPNQRLTWVSQTTWLGLRGLFRKRWRAALSLTTLSLAAACFLVVQTATASVNDTIGAVRAPLAADMTVNFKDPTYFSKIQAQLQALPNVQSVERYGATNASTSWGTLQTYGYEPETRLYYYQLTSGRWMQPGEANVILLSDAALAKTGLTLGDTITLTNNFGATTELTLTIIGTVKQSIDVLGWIGAAVLPVDTLYRLKGVSSAEASQTSSAQIIVGARDRSLDAVNQLAAQVSAVVNPGGASSDDPGYYSGANGTIDTIHEYVTRRQADAYLLYYLLYALALVVGVVGALGLANALVTSVLERRREIGLLRAMGASGRRVAQVFWVESLSLGGFSWLIGAALGLPLAWAFVQTFAWTVMPVDFSLAPLAFAASLVAVLAIATVASVAPAWRASRLRIATALRYE